MLKPIFSSTYFFLIFCLILCNPLAAENLAEYNGGTFKISLVSQKSGNKEIINFKVTESKHRGSSVFSVPNPERIVIDLVGVSIKKNKDFVVSSSRIVKSMRLGAHSDKTRIVLDLNSKDTISYKISESAGTLTLMVQATNGTTAQATSPKSIPTPIELEQLEPEQLQTEQSKPEATAIIKPTETAWPKVSPSLAKTVPLTKTAAPSVTNSVKNIVKSEDIIIDAPSDEIMIEELIEKQPASTPTIAATKTSVRTPTASFTVTAIPTKTSTITPEPPALEKELPASKVVEVPTGNEPQVESPLPQTQALRGIKFAYVEGTKTSQVIKIELVNKSQFELLKTDDKTYILTIKGCREMKPELKLVNFPPHDFSGFTYVQAEANKMDIDIKIGIERNKRITATPNENEIWVSLIEEEKIETTSPQGNKLSPVQRSLNRPSR